MPLWVLYLSFMRRFVTSLDQLFMLIIMSRKTFPCADVACWHKRPPAFSAWHRANSSYCQSLSAPIGTILIPSSRVYAISPPVMTIRRSDSRRGTWVSLSLYFLIRRFISRRCIPLSSVCQWAFWCIEANCCVILRRIDFVNWPIFVECKKDSTESSCHV